VEAANRSDIEVELLEYSSLLLGSPDKVPLLGSRYVRKVNEKLPQDGAYYSTDTLVVNRLGTSTPYWLKKPGELGMYTVDNQFIIGSGESPDPFDITFAIRVGDTRMSFRRPLRHAYTDRVMGEQVQPLELMPPVFAELGKSSYLFTESKPTPVRIKVTAAKANLKGTVELCTPDTWKVTPAKTEISLTRKGEEQYFEFMLTPPEGQAQGMIVPLVKLAGKEEGHTRKLVKIEHDHIPVQLADLDASAPVAKLDLKTAGKNIGYVEGAGDAIPESLRNIGYSVTVLDKATISTGDLSAYDAIVVGIRAYNTEAEMANMNPRLLDYVKGGGTVVVQYNTSRGLRIPQTEIGPYPFQLSRDRTTVEEAEVRILAPDHPVLNYPNKITSKDFDGWVQERGLYFPSSWDERYTPILSSNDPGEDPHDGGMLVAEYGEGHYVYTGYSFFRELPAGVPGAYRLFANLVGLGN